MVFAQVLSQIIKEETSPTQLNFRRRLLNHTFNAYSRNILIGPDAYRLENILYNRFNPITKAFDTGWIYNAAAGTIDTVSDSVADRWHGRAGPLPNKPTCGFRGDSCPENMITGSTLGVLIAACLLLPLTLAFTFFRASR
ncbi:hypothetical protein RvY_11663 [Ramazzottius varieornatus]|uniref:Receptor ligand binding region domain-containing protein n=1 Tax=Ramazzottius varieornatus TaxID=947166 RepID=A0A1D1VGU7_RAMVA|nr:hypothetical protein RvY_11663 [Ramazzottius varieornatus]